MEQKTRQTETLHGVYTRRDSNEDPCRAVVYEGIARGTPLEIYENIFGEICNSTFQKMFKYISGIGNTI